MQTPLGFESHFMPFRFYWDWYFVSAVFKRLLLCLLGKRFPGAFLFLSYRFEQQPDLMRLVSETKRKKASLFFVIIEAT